MNPTNKWEPFWILVFLLAFLVSILVAGFYITRNMASADYQNSGAKLFRVLQLSEKLEAYAKAPTGKIIIGSCYVDELGDIGDFVNLGIRGSSYFTHKKIIEEVPAENILYVVSVQDAFFWSRSTGESLNEVYSPFSRIPFLIRMRGEHMLGRIADLPPRRPVSISVEDKMELDRLFPSTSDKFQELLCYQLKRLGSIPISTVLDFRPERELSGYNVTYVFLPLRPASACPIGGTFTNVYRNDQLLEATMRRCCPSFVSLRDELGCDDYRDLIHLSTKVPDKGRQKVAQLLHNY